MSPAPPPPPAPNSAILKGNNFNSKPASIPNTSALLKSIEKGTKLKKTVTNDRSAPLISGKPSTGSAANSTQTAGSNFSNSKPSGPAGLSGLFANGFPTLKTTKPAVKKDAGSYEDKYENKPPVTKKPEKTLDKSNTSNIAPIAKKHTGPIKNNPSSKPNPTIVNPERWTFSIENENELPKPRKYQGCNKIYLSQIEFGSNACSGGDDEVSSEDIEGFIKNLKTKLSKAASEENFEECVRLKSKLKSFENLEKKINSGEKILISDLPK